MGQTRMTGHRLLPHTADLILEAWAPTRLACLEESVRALVDGFAWVRDASAARPHRVELDATDDRDLLAALLEEAIYVLDALGGVPADVELSERAGVVTASFDVVPIDAVQARGPVPKGVALGDLNVDFDGERWRCRATIDV